MRAPALAGAVMRLYLDVQILRSDAAGTADFSERIVQDATARGLVFVVELDAGGRWRGSADVLDEHAEDECGWWVRRMEDEPNLSGSRVWLA